MVVMLRDLGWIRAETKYWELVNGCISSVSVRIVCIRLKLNKHSFFFISRISIMYLIVVRAWIEKKNVFSFASKNAYFILNININNPAAT